MSAVPSGLEMGLKYWSHGTGGCGISFDLLIYLPADPMLVIRNLCMDMVPLAAKKSL